LGEALAGGEDALHQLVARTGRERSAVADLSLGSVDVATEGSRRGIHLFSDFLNWDQLITRV
jgi:hypothetical protein